MSGSGTLTPAIGFAGKIPARGDFVRAGLPTSFARPWDEWLAAGLAEARARLGEAFDAAYMEAPIWRFALAAGACGPDPAAGVLLPSVDRVGRRFPLTIALALPGADPAGLAACGAWFAALEALALAAIERDLAPDALAAALDDAGMPEAGFVPETAALPADGALDGAWPVLARMLADPALSVWWTAGAPRVAPRAFMARALPDLTGMMADP